jgi:amidohydrolase
MPAVPTMGGEDFALYRQQVPGVYCWFGAGNAARGITSGWRNPHFDIDETALPFGAAAYAQVACDRLKKNPYGDRL